MFNKATLLGRVGIDPEIRNTESGVKVANLSLATNKKYKDKNGEKKEDTQWHRLVAFNRQAEVIEQYVKKGDLLFVEGEIRTNTYEKDGEKRYSTEITISNFQMIGGGNASQSQPQQESKGVPAGNVESGDDSSGLPF